MDDDQRVFDVTRPSKVGPPATSKPVIVGHRPTVSDPMVKGDGENPTNAAPKVTSVPVLMGDEPEPGEKKPEEPKVETELPTDKPAVPEEPVEPVLPHLAPMDMPKNEEPKKSGGSDNEHKYTPLSVLLGGEDSKKPKETPKSDLPTEKPSTGGPSGADDGSHLVGTLPLPHTRGAGPTSRWKKVLGWLLVVLLIVFIGLYLAVDAGWIKTSIKLPFDFINNSQPAKTTTTTTPSTAPKNSAPKSNLPAGFVLYSVKSTSVSFAYPTAWGKPSVTKDAGYSSRGVGKESDGVHAYLINFSKNKDVQVALTSAKLLPVARATLYYDYLQWCVGSVDSLVYKQSLHFNSASGVDTPTTAVCDQGPLNDSTKIDVNTIVQTKTKDAGGSVIGDLYTRNVKDTDYPVVRLLDKSMKLSETINKVLNTVKDQSQ